MQISLDISTETYKRLKGKAKSANMNLQEYIRFLIGDTHTPAVFEVVNSVRFNIPVGETFMFKDLIPEGKLTKSVRAALGRRFLLYVRDISTSIEIVEKSHRGYVYRRIS